MTQCRRDVWNADNANRLIPGATLSGLNRYTQQHLSVCPWKWNCLCALECLCIAHSLRVYVKCRLDEVEEEKLRAAFSAVRYFPSKGNAKTWNTNTPAHTKTHAHTPSTAYPERLEHINIKLEHMCIRTLLDIHKLTEAEATFDMYTVYMYATRAERGT